MKGSLLRAVNRKKRSPMYSSAKGARSRLTSGDPSAKAVDTFGGATARRGYKATTSSKRTAGAARRGVERTAKPSGGLAGLQAKMRSMGVQKEDSPPLKTEQGGFVSAGLGSAQYGPPGSVGFNHQFGGGRSDLTANPGYGSGNVGPMATSGPSGELQAETAKTVDRSVRSTEGFSASKAGGLGDVLASAKRRRRGSRY